MLAQGIVIFTVALCHAGSTYAFGNAERIAQLILRPNEFVHDQLAHEEKPIGYALEQAVVRRPHLYDTMLQSGSNILHTVLRDSTGELTSVLSRDYRSYVMEFRNPAEDLNLRAKRFEIFHNAIYSRLADLEAKYPESFKHNAQTAIFQLENVIELHVTGVANGFHSPVGTPEQVEKWNLEMQKREKKFLSRQADILKAASAHEHIPRPSFQYLSPTQVEKALEENPRELYPADYETPSGRVAPAPGKFSHSATGAPSQEGVAGQPVVGHSSQEQSKESVPQIPGRLRAGITRPYATERLGTEQPQRLVNHAA